MEKIKVFRFDIIDFLCYSSYKYLPSIFLKEILIENIVKITYDDMSKTVELKYLSKNYSEKEISFKNSESKIAFLEKMKSELKYSEENIFKSAERVHIKNYISLFLLSFLPLISCRLTSFVDAFILEYMPRKSYSYTYSVLSKGNYYNRIVIIYSSLSKNVNTCDWPIMITAPSGIICLPTTFIKVASLELLFSMYHLPSSFVIVA